MVAGTRSHRYRHSLIVRFDDGRPHRVDASCEPDRLTRAAGFLRPMPLTTPATPVPCRLDCASIRCIAACTAPASASPDMATQPASARTAAAIWASSIRKATAIPPPCSRTAMTTPTEFSSSEGIPTPMSCRTAMAVAAPPSATAGNCRHANVSADVARGQNERDPQRLAVP